MVARGLNPLNVCTHVFGDKLLEINEGFIFFFVVPVVTAFLVLYATILARSPRGRGLVREASQVGS